MSMLDVDHSWHLRVSLSRRCDSGETCGALLETRAEVLWMQEAQKAHSVSLERYSV